MTEFKKTLELRSETDAAGKAAVFIDYANVKAWAKRHRQIIKNTDKK